MAKDLPYFKFYSSEWNDGDITLEDMKTQGVFINICSYYWSRECRITLDAVERRFKDHKNIITNLRRENLIKTYSEPNGNLTKTYLQIRFLDEQWQGKDRRSTTSRTNGAKGGRPAKPNKPNLTQLIEEESIEENSIEEKRREEESISKDSPSSEINQDETKHVEPLYHEYFEIFQGIKPFNIVPIRSEAISLFREAAQSVPEQQILESAKNYKQHCYHAEQPIDYRKSVKNFLSEKQYKIDWLMQHKINKRGDSPPELWDLWLARNNKYPNFEWST